MATLKEVLAKETTILCPMAYDGMTARIVEMNGFPIVDIGGMHLAASGFGLPDVGLLTLTEVLEKARIIVRAVNIPVLCDVDTGFGGINNARRMVHEFEAAGVSCVRMEDQIFPGRAGTIPGKSVVSVEEFLPKLKAVVAARKSKDFLIMARTDCKELYGMDEVIRRLNIYADNGADLGASGSSHTFAEHERMAKEVRIPLKANCAMDQIAVPLKQWENTGVKMVGYMAVPLYFSMKAMAKSIQALKNGTIGDIMGECATHEDRRHILKMDEWLKWAENWTPK